jgi:hypothetical protein
MTVLDLLCLALSTGQVCDTWLNGTIFAGWRAHLELNDTWFSRLMSCAFCLSHHVVVLLCLLLLISTLMVNPWDFVIKLPIYALAALRISVILNGLLPDHLKY